MITVQPMSRRKFLKETAVASAVLVTGGLLSSCGGPSSSSAKPTSLNMLYATVEADSDAIKLVLPLIVVPFHHHVPTGCCRHSGVHPGGQTPTLRYVSGPDHPLYCLQPTDRDLDTSQHHLSATRRDRGSSSRRRLLTTWHDCQDSSPAHRVWDGNECYLEHHSVLERIPVCLIADPFGRADGSCGDQRVHRRHVRDPMGPSHCRVYASPVAHHSDDPHSAWYQLFPRFFDKPGQQPFSPP